MALSPNMFLPIPDPSSTPGPLYATDLANSLTIIDQHTHVAGSGAPITPAALNINAAIPMNNNSINSIASLIFFAQASQTSTLTMYTNATDLFYIDGNGNNIRITQSGSVTGSSGTITGLPSGTASAAFASGTFVFQAATNTPANIDGGSFILRNNSANSFGVTLSPPNSLGANYNLVLPAIPAQTNVMTLDTSGNMGSVTWNAVAENRTRSTGTTVGLGGVAISNASGTASTTSSTPAQISALTVTLTTSGRPVNLLLTAVGSSGSNLQVGSTLSGNSQVTGQIYIYRGATPIFETNIAAIAPVTSGTAIGISVPASSIAFVDAITAGTYTYSIYYAAGNNSNFTVVNCQLVAYEL